MYAWRVALDVAAYGWRIVVVAVERFVSFIPALATGRFTKFLWPMAMGGAARRYFIRTRRKGPSAKWQRIKSELLEAAGRFRQWWREQHFVTKSALVALMIAVQVHLHWWLVFFPIGFLVPYLVMVLNSLQRWVLGPVIEQLYLSRFGKAHAYIKSVVLRWRWVQRVIGVYRLYKLYFETGWRIWYYDARFRFPTWRPFWRETVGRVWFAITTIPRGEWAKRRLYNQPLLGGIEHYEIARGSLPHAPEAAE